MRGAAEPAVIRSVLIKAAVGVLSACDSPPCQWCKSPADQASDAGSPSGAWWGGGRGGRFGQLGKPATRMVLRVLVLDYPHAHGGRPNSSASTERANAAGNRQRKLDRRASLAGTIRRLGKQEPAGLGVLSFTSARAALGQQYGLYNGHISL